jgi:hypothetical protein
MGNMAKCAFSPHNYEMKYSRLMKSPIVVLAAIVMVACDPNEAVVESMPESGVLPVAAAAGSMGPNLISGADGTIVLSWLEPEGEGHALRHSRLQGGSWSVPRTVAKGDNWFVNWADFPSVVPISDSLWAAHWLVSQESGGYAYDVRTALSADSGDTWSESVIPHTDGTDTEHGFVSLFADSGGVGMIWLDGRKMVNEYDETNKIASGMTLRSATFDRDLLPFKEALVDDLICDCCQTDIAITADGPIAVYRNRTVSEIRDIYVSRREFGEWQPGHPVGDDNWEIAACPVNGPVIQAAESTVAVAWFTAPNESPRVKVAWSDDAGRSFGQPVEVATDQPLGHVGATLLDDGDLALSWLRSAGGGSAELLLSRISRSGEISVPHVVKEAADVFAFSVPQLSRDGDMLIVAWTTEVDSVYGIASAMIPASIL